MTYSKYLTPFLAICSLACGPATESVDTAVCASGERWIGGNSESEEMRPGGECISCHRHEDGPTFAFAGTVFEDLHQDDDCLGLSGVTVRITDANGDVYESQTNRAGNFSFKGRPAFPYTAAISLQGTELRMATPQMDGDCNSCHTKTGANNAVGRILMTLGGQSPPAALVDAGAPPL